MRAGAPGEVAADDLGWRDVFADGRLQALVALALENNRDLRVAALTVELTRAQHRIQRADRLPAVAASAAATRQHAGGDLTASGEPETTTRYTAGLGATAFELDLFGRARSLSAAALEQYLATEEARRSAQLALVAEAALQHLAVRALDEQVALATRTLEAVESSHRLTLRTFEAGRASELDVALGARAALDEQLEAQRARVAAEQRRYELSELRYRKGVDGYLGVLTAQRDLYAAQQLLIQARLARLANLVDLYRALGGGWREHTAPAAGDGTAAR